jgi:hypothetical protein
VLEVIIGPDVLSAGEARRILLCAEGRAGHEI